MPIVNLAIPLTRQDIRHLGKMTRDDLRSAEMQLAWLVRQEAERRGLTHKSEETGLVSQAKPVSSSTHSATR